MQKRIFCLGLLWITTTVSISGCGNDAQTGSTPLVTDVEHTSVKRQSIGNCWLYAAATWAESLHLAATGEDMDISESYWTWWHWYDQIVRNRWVTEISTGGHWQTSSAIIAKHGVVTESEFIPAEDGAQMSNSQAIALAEVNLALQPGGSLADFADRTPEKVRAVLDQAFGTDMSKAELAARAADEFLLSEDGKSLSEMLAGDVASRWVYEAYPRIYGKRAKPSAAQKKARARLLRRVMRALNDYQPVVMSTMIDFNAMDTEDNGSFKWETLRQSGKTGNQGGHMVVLEDYTVRNVPGYGQLGRGDLSKEEKTAALQGDLVDFIAKNSWGTDRDDRGIIDGYTSFDIDYLDAQWDWDPETGESFYTTLSGFVLPPGY